MSRSNRRRRPSGSTAMRENGYKEVSVWFDPTELARVKAAADRAGKPLATWIRETAHDAALEDQHRVRRLMESNPFVEDDARTAAGDDLLDHDQGEEVQGEGEGG